MVQKSTPNHDDIIKKYKDGKSINQIRLEYGVTHKVIKRIIESHGITPPKNVPFTKLTYDEIREEALKYKHRSHFMKGNLRCYSGAIRRKILDEVCSHMEPLGDYFRRLVYVYEFEDNHVYVGLTCNKDKRHGEHIRDGRGPVYKHKQKTGLEPKYKMISDFYINWVSAQKLERDTVNHYKESGWILLNTARAGNLGGNTIKWTEESLRNESLKYSTRYEMQLKNPAAYSSIISKKMKHLFSHMKWEGNIEHTLEECVEEAKKYTCRQDFRKARYDLWQYTYKHKYEDIVFTHMKKQRVLKWNTQEAVEISKKYKTVKEFEENDYRAYRHLCRQKNYHELTKHLIRLN